MAVLGCRSHTRPHLAFRGLRVDRHHCGGGCCCAEPLIIGLIIGHDCHLARGLCRLPGLSPSPGCTQPLHGEWLTGKGPEAKEAKD